MKKLLFMLLFVLQIAYPAISLVSCSSIANQSDGKLIVASSVVDSDIVRGIILRYAIDGSLDSSFGSDNNGIVPLNIGTSFFPTAVQVQSTQRILVSGYSTINTSTQFVLAGIMPNGSYDTSFGQSSSGIITTPIGTGCCAFALTIQSDDKIIQAGVVIQDDIPSFGVVRYTTDGQLDTTFGNMGIVTQTIGTAAVAQAITVQSDGKIVITGWALVNGVKQCVIARYTSDGDADQTFGVQGIVTQPIGTSSAGNSITIDTMGNILVGGVSDSKFTIARFTSNGVLDATFGLNGIISEAIGLQDQVNVLLLQTEGTIVAIGTSDNNTVLARYLNSGVIDTTFGQNGKTITQFSVVNMPNSALNYDANIMMTGFRGSHIILMNFTHDGLYDLSWGMQGTIGLTGDSLLNETTVIRDQKAQGTAGGGFAAGNWQTRTLNIITNGTAYISLLNNQIFIKPGLYAVRVSAPAYKTESHQVRFQNITDNITIEYGASAFSNTNDASMTSSNLLVPIFVSKPTVFEVQHQCQTTELIDGFGVPANFGTEIYTEVLITRKG